MKTRDMKSLFVFLLFLLFLPGVLAGETLKPYVLASKADSDFASTVGLLKARLSAAGFELVGDYSPYAGAAVLVISNSRLKENAAKTDFGGFGAIQRVTVTSVDGEVQVAYTNPVYMANVYRLADELTDVRDSLKTALGDRGEFGPEEGLTAEALRSYHYKWLMPYFYDRLELAEHGSYAVATKKVEQQLEKHAGGTTKVYRVDIPGKEQTVFGVALSGPESDTECSGDQYIMQRIDFKKIRSTGHLPYEILVNGGKVYALPAEFRIAIGFPDLSMVGSNSFASIMCAPSAIESALTQAAGAKEEF